MKLASIDIGSNAVRLLLARVYEINGETMVKKESLVRMPIRLGDDAFTARRISAGKIDRLVETMRAFRFLIRAYESLDYVACATSALREAENGSEVVDRICDEADVHLEIIDGRREAEVLCLSRPSKLIARDRTYMFIDVGGGSTEITLFRNNETVNTASFRIGGIRILKGGVTESDWNEMKRWLKTNTKLMRPVTSIGSGGNINKVFRLARKREGQSIAYDKIKSIYDDIKNYSFEDRIRVLQLRPDRADVIVPACEIYLSAMKWTRSKEMYVPIAGLSDGLVYELYLKQRSVQRAHGDFRPEIPHEVFERPN